ncbi:MAG: hypothetical protein K0U29_07050 [Gammaproteobacteria bacterium]|nr:hypothetical protein [Gammaproteobacteria bacterium]
MPPRQPLQLCSAAARRSVANRGDNFWTSLYASNIYLLIDTEVETLGILKISVTAGTSNADAINERIRACIALKAAVSQGATYTDQQKTILRAWMTLRNCYKTTIEAYDAVASRGTSAAPAEPDEMRQSRVAGWAFGPREPKGFLNQVNAIFNKGRQANRELFSEADKLKYSSAQAILIARKSALEQEIKHKGQFTNVGLKRKKMEGLTQLIRLIVAHQRQNSLPLTLEGFDALVIQIQASQEYGSAFTSGWMSGFSMSFFGLGKSRIEVALDEIRAGLKEAAFMRMQLGP